MLGYELMQELLPSALLILILNYPRIRLKFVLVLQDHVANLHIRLSARYPTRNQFKSPISVLRLQTTPTDVSPFPCFVNTYCGVSNFRRGHSMLH